MEELNGKDSLPLYGKVSVQNELYVQERKHGCPNISI